MRLPVAGIQVRVRDRVPAVQHHTIVSIAEAHDKTSAQIILRWHLQVGNIAIPGSSNPDHILENLSIFDFSLSDEEMENLTALDRNERFADY